MVQRNKGLNVAIRYKGGASFISVQNPITRSNALIEPSVSPSYCEKVFEWNKTDTSQFASSVSYSDNGGDGALVVTASAEHGNVLRLSGTAGTGAHFAILASDAITFPDDRRDMLFEIDFLDWSSAGANVYAGVVLLADSGSNYSALNHLHCGASGEQASRVDEDVLTGSTALAGTPIQSSNGAYTQFNVRGFKTAGSPPSLASFLKYWTSSAGSGCSRRTGADRGSVKQFADGNALPSTWNGLTCNRWGLCMESRAAGSLVNLKLDIISLKVYIYKSGG